MQCLTLLCCSPDGFRHFLAAFEPFKDIGINLALQITYALIIRASKDIELAFLALLFDHIAKHEAAVSASFNGPVFPFTPDFNSNAHRRTYITQDVGLPLDFIKVFLNGYLQGILDCNFQLLANFRIELQFLGLLLFRRLLLHFLPLFEHFITRHRASSSIESCSKSYNFIRTVHALFLIDLDLKSGKAFIDFRQSVEVLEREDLCFLHLFRVLNGLHDLLESRYVEIRIKDVPQVPQNRLVRNLVLGQEVSPDLLLACILETQLTVVRHRNWNLHTFAGLLRVEIDLLVDLLVELLWSIWRSVIECT
jgi:hypothetical protein